MSTPPDSEVYRPPDKSAGNVHEWPVMLTEVDAVLVRQHIYRGKVADFAIMQLHREGEDEHEIARIDCCHGTVHRHVFDRAGNDLVDGRVIQVIPCENGRDTLTLLFGECLDRMMDEYDANLRRWKSS